MHLSLWTIESRDFIMEWSIKKFPKIPAEVINSWMNLHLFTLDQHSKIITIESDELIVTSSECKPSLFFLLLTTVKDEKRISQVLLNYVLTQARCILSMFADMDSCESVAEYRREASVCSWAIAQLLDVSSQPLDHIPWSFVAQSPQVVLAYCTPLFQACLCDSMPTPLACLLSRERELAATPSWNNLATDERICLTTFSRIHTNLSDCLVKLPSMDDKSMYRLVQVELVLDVALIILCGSQLSMADIQDKILKYWSPLLDDISSFQPQNLLYASVDGIPTSLRAFFLLQSDKHRCVQGFMRFDVSVDKWVEESMKKLVLRFKAGSSLALIRASYTSIFEKSENITVTLHESCDQVKLLVLAFDGHIKSNEVRQLITQVDTKLDHWLHSGGYV